MFTGIIETVGTVESISTYSGGGSRLTVNCGKLRHGLKPGDSLAVDGVCLTVVQKSRGKVLMDIAAETLSLTRVSSYEKGTVVNLELPLRANSMVSGHFVQGHVDGVGRVLEWKCSGRQNVRLRVKLPATLIPYCILKGSVAINGVSLTISNLKAQAMEIALIPYTLDHTNLGLLRRGEPVNIETDMLGRYVVSLVKKAYHMPKKAR